MSFFCALVSQLADEPYADQKRGWNERDPREHEDNKTNLV
jgi:hypothetical protein